MKIELWLSDCSSPRIYDDVINVFKENDYTCIDLPDRILKYPTNHVFRIVELKQEVKPERVKECSHSYLKVEKTSIKDVFWYKCRDCGKTWINGR